MTQTTLFDTAPLIPIYCHVKGCQAIKLPTDSVAPACLVDAKRILGITTRRPTQCLNHYDPANAPFPEAY
jgi:hypothetical protein